MTIHELRRRSNEFISNLNAVIIDVVGDCEKQIIAINQEQMRYGKNSKGGKIGQLHNLFYAREKINKGGSAPFGDVDLYDTGQFQSKMMLWTDGQTYEIGSTDRKEADLAAKYGQEIFGLMPTFHEDAQKLTGIRLAEKYNQLVLK